MTRSLLIVFLLASNCFGQATAVAAEAEQKDLNTALSEAGNSPVEFTRALEAHLRKYPDSVQKDEIERALVKTAIEGKDDARILQYGERVLAKNINNPQVLERVARALLKSGDKASSERALKYSIKYEEILRALEVQAGASGRDRARALDEVERALARALALQARAQGNLGNVNDAIASAVTSFDESPNAESAREAAKWLAEAGRNMDAVKYYALAFAVTDTNNTEAGRAKDRSRMGALYAKQKGSEAGLGDLVLEAYDKLAMLEVKRLAVQQERDPNAGRTEVLDFTVSGIGGKKLALTSLRGKVIVLDFWATWCGPCRIQHPLYEQVKTKFAGRSDVVFLAINTDEDNSQVESFLDNNKWNKSSVYFEDGLSSLLQVSSIPTTVIIDGKGKLVSRMNGFLPDKFVGQLTSRIQEALKGS